ncbi:hypothetical protein, partial [Endozoicomonas numazuensis]|uniref:hypothetical protein n=1 Tax=Endozoicomonas numazuensis TaxID=1137799 RepID=UPI00054D8B73
METQDYDPKAQSSESVGVDFGIKDLAICSNGKTFAANQKLKHSLKRLAILHEVSDYLTANFSVIAIEDLNVRGMTK